jgi:hypothetical protein
MTDDQALREIEKLIEVLSQAKKDLITCVLDRVPDRIAALEHVAGVLVARTKVPT